MKLCAWLSAPLLTISTCSPVISAYPTSLSHDITAVAGSIAQINTTHVTNTTKSALELEYEALEVLKQQLFHLHHEVLKKEHDILRIINEDFRSCSGVKCYLQTALRKAPDFFELVKTHFRHGAENVSGTYYCPTFANSSWMQSNPESSPSSEEDHKYDDGRYSSPFDFNSPGAENSPLGLDDGQSDGPFDSDTGSDEGLALNLDAEPSSDGPVSSDAPLSAFDFDSDAGKGSFESDQPDETSPVFSPQYHNEPHHERPPFHMPHPAPRPRHYTLILATTGCFLSLLILLVLFKGLRVYCANPRVRADRAARIEECRTRREYRRAACLHRLRQCLSKFRFSQRSESLSTDDYEEKEAMLRGRNMNVLPVADVENHIIGTTITSLRHAHEFVGQLILAEEGRSRPFSCSNPQMQPQTRPLPEIYQPSSSRPRSIHSTTTTLPPYSYPHTQRTASPPRCSQELSREIVEVVDGFRYTPTPSDATPSVSASSFIIDDCDDGTEGTSVVDCRSRVSIETTTMGRPSVSSLSRGGRSRGGSLELAGDRYIGRFD